MSGIGAVLCGAGVKCKELLMCKAKQSTNTRHASKFCVAGGNDVDALGDWGAACLDFGAMSTKHVTCTARVRWHPDHGSICSMCSAGIATCSTYLHWGRACTL